ncbi:MAG: YgiQ family radical SAM protein [Gammaproteobacteria bacterium]|nr:YgiQ family radical SAM protein [Gammaproteobacteria bacterium]MBT3866935.1 YgiQ family radical SAM protein [Gammaproteobacteria bacterium]MBT4617735.1 YgiQ family radical SAM protein [Gammaproteobacteria bacterium]MBT5198228.1 YgiQ family radical SAM protein [Gammaproteobacteria bacterium]MBT5445297.1 YgiQ family radical SAM protein [Gammaproteobacteria bacterium]
MQLQPSRKLDEYRPYWAECFGIAPFLPTSRAEMDALGWDSCDVIIVTGDAYVDHPSFGMAVIGRVLEAQGFRVGIIAQPEWRGTEEFSVLGKPNLYFGVAAGNMDSMINRYTADKKIRHDDAYTPGNIGGRRPDRSVIVYSQRCRETYPDVPIVIGSIEASLRRIAHFDYWSEKIRRSVLLDAKADMLLFGNAERAIVELTHRMASGEAVADIQDIRGTAYVTDEPLAGWRGLDETRLPDEKADSGVRLMMESAPEYIELPSFEAVLGDKALYAHASRLLHRETNPGNARALAQRHGDKIVWLNPPPIPLTTPELDWVFERPYQRIPHPGYGEDNIPAYEMIRHSVNIMRGCFGGCTFCSITEHEGRIIQSRSQESIINEISEIRDKSPAFTGVISDLGGPTANMWRLNCKDKQIEESCRRPSCVYPSICKNLDTDQTPLISLYRKAREVEGVKKVLIASGLRYDLAVETPEYVKELVTEHVGGYLKIAPEHTEQGPLSKMMKPGIGTYDTFKAMFEKYSQEAGKKQYLIPYFIAGHPGTTDDDMLNLARWLKENGFRADQVQTFYPSPMATATAMYYSERNPLKRVARSSEHVSVVAKARQRRLHKAFLRYHDPDNWPMLREALRKMGRSDLIGNGKMHLIPRTQFSKPGYRGSRPFSTQHNGLPKNPGQKRRK